MALGYRALTSTSTCRAHIQENCYTQHRIHRLGCYYRGFFHLKICRINKHIETGAAVCMLWVGPSSFPFGLVCVSDLTVSLVATRAGSQVSPISCGSDTFGKPASPHNDRGRARAAGEVRHGHNAVCCCPEACDV